VKGPIGYSLWGRLGGVFGQWRRQPLRPEQQLASDALEQDKINDIVAKQDARYDAMTDSQRDKYYMKPSMRDRIKKSLRGQ
jgi:hypothetical protein